MGRRRYSDEVDNRATPDLGLVQLMVVKRGCGHEHLAAPQWPPLETDEPRRIGARPGDPDRPGRAVRRAGRDATASLRPHAVRNIELAAAVCWQGMPCKERRV